MKKTRILIGIILLICLGLFIINNKNNNNKNNDEFLKIGMITSLSGSFAENGEEARNAAVLAVEEINKRGGINGKKINLIIEDGKCDSATAVNAYNKLVKVDGVKFILGGHCSSETLAIAPLVDEDNVIALANITSANFIENEGKNVFRNSPPSNYIATKASEYVVNELSFKKIGIINEQKEFPLSYGETFKKRAQELGAEIIFEESFVPGTNNFQTIITKIKGHDVDVVLVSTQSAETAGIIAKQMKDINYDSKNIYNAGFNYSSFLKTRGGAETDDFIVVAGYVDENSDKVKDFISSYEEKFDREIKFNLYYISAVYDMVNRLEENLLSCGSTEDVVCVSEQFAKANSFTGVSGNVKISSDFAPSSALMPLGLLKVMKDGSIHIEAID